MNRLNKSSAPIQKLKLLSQGQIVVMSDYDLDALEPFDVSNVIRTRPNPKQVGMLDRWEAWIEKRDLARFTELNTRIN